MTVQVVILNYNGKEWLEKFLGKVIKHSPEAEVVVIDNASTDESVSFLLEHFQDVKLIRLTENFGFAGGYHKGLSELNGDVFVLLNSDVEVTENWLKPMIHAFQTHPNLAAAQPKIKAFKNPEYFEHAGACGGFMDKWCFPFCRGRIFETVEEDIGQYDEASEIFWATGACMFIRNDVYREAGGLDERFFAHMEEIDLCWRIKNLGYEIKCIPSAVVYHVGGGTLAYENPKKTFLNFRNSLYCIHKNRSGVLLPFIIFRLILDGVASAKFLFQGKLDHSVAVLKAHIHYYGKIKSLQKERRKIKRTKYNKLHGVYPKSIVWQHFIKNKNTYQSLYDID